MREINLRALAKINLGLDVLGRRPDGYHQVRMVMQSVYLYDKVRLQKEEEPGIRLDCSLSFLPTGAENIAWKAAHLLQQEFALPGGIRIELQKHIPVAAGLAGGSSNAAAVLFGMNRLYGLGLSRDQLMERGARLGADVPYCICRGTMLAEGIGEVLSPLPPMPGAALVLAKPPVSVSTAMVYQALDELEAYPHPDIDGLIGALGTGDLKTRSRFLGNCLEQVTIPRFPVIRQIKEKLLMEGALGALMSGSGPTVFGIFSDWGQARRAWKALRESGLARQVYLCKAAAAGGGQGALDRPGKRPEA